jgi:hypothetical protein
MAIDTHAADAPSAPDAACAASAPVAPDAAGAPPADAPARSRRALLSAGLGGLAGLFASRLAAPGPAAAAAGDPLLIGNTANTAGTANTTLATTSSGTALLVTQNGTGTALRGSAVGAGSIAGFFTAANGTGISGVTAKSSGYGVFGSNDGDYGGLSTGAGVRANGKNNHGLVATTDNGGANAVRATNAGVGGGSGSAILAFAEANCTGVTARAQSGAGVFGFAVNGSGVYGSSGNEIGVEGHGNPGVYGISTNVFGSGVEGVGLGSSGHGVVGSATADSGNAAGIYGAGVGAAFAGYFEGHVHATGGFSSTSATSIRIDHPLAPAEKVLQHSAVSSDEALTIYSGTVTTDAQGEATVELPGWFEALNTDLRYQLTVIGSFAQAMVKREVKANRFGIATSEPATKVSWQLTGVRNDAYARAHPRAVEVAKTKAERGTYLTPVEHGEPESKGFDYPMRQRLREPRPASARPNLE